MEKIHEKEGLPKFGYDSQMLSDTKKLTNSWGKFDFSILFVFFLTHRSFADYGEIPIIVQLLAFPLMFHVVSFGYYSSLLPCIS